MENIKLTKADHMILESYITIMEGLADYLGEGYELVLHSLENLNQSVVKIINGHHTGRVAGAPITDLALSMLADIEKNKDKKFITYFNNKKKDRPLKSSTIAIYGENQKVIGLLCINLYLNIPFSVLISSFVQTSCEVNEQIDEVFLDNTSDLVEHACLEAIEFIQDDSTISVQNRNKEIISILYDTGIFNIKDSIIKVAEHLAISKNTVYMHLRNIRDI